MRAVPSPANTDNTPLCISWDQGAVTALGVCQPVRAARSGPDNLCCQSHLVSISVSAVPGGQGLVITGSHRYLRQSPAQHFTWSVKTSRQPPDWKGSAALRSKWPTVLISLNCLFFCVILTQCWSRRNISKSSILLLKWVSAFVFVQGVFEYKVVLIVKPRSIISQLPLQSPIAIWSYPVDNLDQWQKLIIRS